MVLDKCLYFSGLFVWFLVQEVALYLTAFFLCSDEQQRQVALQIHFKHFTFDSKVGKCKVWFILFFVAQTIYSICLRFEITFFFKFRVLNFFKDI